MDFLNELLFLRILRGVKNIDMDQSEEHKHKRIISLGNIYVVVEQTPPMYLFTVFLPLVASITYI